jgi:hypothetical protein
MATEWSRGKWPKKYEVTVNGKRIAFGDQRYEQYRDSSPLGLYKDKDHNDKKRQANYTRRHAKNTGIAARLSKQYLWT